MQHVSRPFSASFCSDAVPAGYAVKASGVYVIDGDSSPLRITNTPCWISAKLRDVNGKRWSVRLHMLTEDGEEKVLLVPYTHVIGSALGYVIHNLAENGMLFPAGEKPIRQFLSDSANRDGLPKLRTVGQLGFFEYDEPANPGSRGIGFMLPHAVIQCDGGSQRAANQGLVFQPTVDSASLAAYATAGELADWQDLVRPLGDTALHVTAICAAFAGPFLTIAGLENGGINLFGQSSSGKTTSLQLAASVWGNGSDPQRAGHSERLIERWNSTANAMEPVIAAHSGMLLALDELGSSQDPNIYNLIGGHGKSRMKDDCSLRTAYKWTIFVLSTGEDSVQTKIETDGRRRARTGELMRIIDVPVDELPTDSSFTQEDMRVIIDGVKTGCATTFGTAGIAFVREVLGSYSNPEELRAAIGEDLRLAHSSLCQGAEANGKLLSSPQKRAMMRLALIQTVGVWASEIHTFSADQVIKAVESVRDAWLGASSNKTVAEEAIEALTEYATHYSEQMENGDADLGQGWGANSPPKGIVSNGRLLLSKAQLEDALGTLPRTDALKALYRAGVLIKHGEAQYNAQQQVRSRGFSARYYTFRLDKLDVVLDVMPVDDSCTDE